MMDFLQSQKSSNELACTALAKSAVPKVFTLPLDIHLALTEKCNYRCRMCYQPSFKDDMDERILDCIAPLMPFAKNISLLGGEPFVYKRLGEVLDLCNDNQCSISFATNGSLLTDSLIGKLMESRSVNMSVSLDAATPKTYQFIRKGDFFNVLGNVAKYSKMRLANKVAGQLILNFVAMKENIGELPKLVLMASELGASCVRVNFLATKDAELAKSSLYYDQERSDACMRKAKMYGDEKGVAVQLPKLFSDTSCDAAAPQMKDCYRPWTNLHINVHGDAYLCCASNGVMPSSGNLLKDGLDAVWNGKFSQHIRANVNSDTLPAPCKKCFVYKASPTTVSQHVRCAAAP